MENCGCARRQLHQRRRRTPVDGVKLKSSTDHIAAAVRRSRPSLSHTSFAKRGLLASEVHEQQLGAALALEPDFVSVIAGANDALKGQWQAERYEHEMRTMLEAFEGLHSTVMASLPSWTERLTLPEERRTRAPSLKRATRSQQG